MLAKKVILTVSVFFICGSFIFAKENTASVKLSLVPSISTPKKDIVEGLDFAIISTKSKKVTGFQFSFLYAEIAEKSKGAQMAVYSKTQDFDGAKAGLISLSENVRGYNLGAISFTNDFTGFQTGLVTSNSSIKGLQIGIVNVSEKVTGVQIGLVNLAENMEGVQLGVFNVIRQSHLPVMIILNAKFN
ncbi:MAG: hypothetical protein NT145_01200 [Elusimicrobia bacterium]|nr:hypothetical protein [Elusimicrobiota bacterium]